MKIGGTFNGTGATAYIGIGFIPDFVRLWNLEATNALIVEWNRNFVRSVEHSAGHLFTDAPSSTSTEISRLTIGTGVSIFRGNVVAAAANTAYIVADNENHQLLAKTWTLDTVANRTGHSDVELSTTYVGEGSRIIIREALTQEPKECYITAMTSNGEAADEITLSEAVKSGDILYIGNMYTHIAAAAGVRIPQGFTVTNNTVNASGNIIAFEAGLYDN